jgi:hypothetical protein
MQHLLEHARQLESLVGSADSPIREAAHRLVSALRKHAEDAALAPPINTDEHEPPRTNEIVILHNGSVEMRFFPGDEKAALAFVDRFCPGLAEPGEEAENAGPGHTVVVPNVMPDEVVVIRDGVVAVRQSHSSAEAHGLGVHVPPPLPGTTAQALDPSSQASGGSVSGGLHTVGE